MKNKKLLFIIIAAIMLMAAGITAFATGSFKMKYEPGTEDTVTNMPAEADWAAGSSNTVALNVPEREGYEFLGWQLDYKTIDEPSGYTVTYVVNPDEIYGKPDVSEPIDKNVYALGATVIVAENLKTEQIYAFDPVTGEKIKGTWEFTPWDQNNFQIFEDTVITGKWTFTIAPPKKYNYTVEYWLVDGTKRIDKVAEDKPDTVDALGTNVVEEAIPMGSKLLKTKYRSPAKYRIKPSWEKVTTTIYKEDQVIYIFYELIPHGQ